MGCVMFQVQNPNAFYVTTNRYGGQCHSCLKPVGMGEEMLYRRSDKKMHHTACPINEPVTLEELGITAPTTQTTEDTPQNDSAIVDGYYTVQRENGTHITFRIRTQKDDASFAPGQQVIATLTGSDNEGENSYRGWGFVANGDIRVWKSKANKVADWPKLAEALISGNWKAAGVMYATESGNCFLCNRLLTVVSSVQQGVGPICAKRL